MVTPSVLSYIHYTSCLTIKMQTTNKNVDLGFQGAIVGMCDRTEKLQMDFKAGKMPSVLLTFNKLPYKIAIQVSKILDTSLGQSAQFISSISASITTNTVWHEWHSRKRLVSMFGMNGENSTNSQQRNRQRLDSVFGINNARRLWWPSWLGIVLIIQLRLSLSPTYAKTLK